VNITYVKLKSVVTELRAIRLELARLADCWETELAEQGIRMRVDAPTKTTATGPEPTLSYEDEELAWARETIEFVKREEQRAEDDAKAHEKVLE
jgi:hypothetical protein